MPFTAHVSNFNDLLIRDYVPADWTQICRVHDAARLQELAAGAVDPRAFRPMADVAARDGFFASQTLVACDGIAVVGFVSWRDAYITWLYVEPRRQRRGVGRRLLENALRQIGPDAWTNMIAGNEPALALYRAVGMEVVCTRPGDCEGYSCNAMRLALPSSPMRDPAAERQASP